MLSRVCWLILLSFICKTSNKRGEIKYSQVSSLEANETRATSNDHMEDRENGTTYQNENVLSYEASNTWAMLNNFFKYTSLDVDTRERIFIAKNSQSFSYKGKKKIIFLLVDPSGEKRRKIYEKIVLSEHLKLLLNVLIFFKTFLVATLLSTCKHRSAGVEEVNS